MLCARAGALATETRLEIKFEGGIYQILPNNALSTIALGNLQELADLRYNDQETQFALRLREHLPRPRSLDSIQQVISLRGETGRGSTDVGDVAAMVAESNRPWVVARGDAAALAAALDAMVADAGLREQLGLANRQRCEQEFEQAACLERYVELIARVADGG